VLTEGARRHGIAAEERSLRQRAEAQPRPGGIPTPKKCRPHLSESDCTFPLLLVQKILQPRAQSFVFRLFSNHEPTPHGQGRARLPTPSSNGGGASPKRCCAGFLFISIFGMNIAELRIFLNGFLYFVFGILENYIHFFPENPNTSDDRGCGGIHSCSCIFHVSV